MQVKTCSTCKKEKPVSEFFKGARYKDGYRGQCKQCTMAKSKEYANTEKGNMIAREATRQWRIKNPEYIKKKTKEDYANGGKEYHREQRRKKKEQYLAYTRKYAQTHREKREQYRKIYHQENPERRQAKQAVFVAVKKGILPPIATQLCSRCSNQAQDYHHWSYLPEHWLDVIPLCRQCHADTHYPLK